MNIGLININLQKQIIQKLDKAAAENFETSFESALKNKQKQQLKRACEEFESIFINIIMQKMRSSIPEYGIQKSFGREIYESMFDQEVSKEMAKSGGIGLAKQLYDQLSKYL